MSLVKTRCDICGHTGCSLNITIESDKIIKIEGDPEDPRTNGKICTQALAIKEILSSKERLTHPLIRTKNNKWKTASWDEALTKIAVKLTKLKEQNGPKSIAFATGYSRTYARTVNTYINKLAKKIGTPNITGMEHVCALPRMLATSYVFGPIDPWRSADMNNSNCIILWGINPVHDPTRIKTINQALKGKKTLIAVDPRATPFAKKADLHLQIKPGTDGALALSMINVIINNKLFNEDFIQNWTIGFEQLAELVRSYSPEKVSQITWLDPNDIVKAATLYTSKGPSSIDLGNALDQHTNNFQTIRAIASLIAVSGNLDIPGGNLPRYGATFKNESNAEKRTAVGQERFPLALRAHMPSIWRAVLTGDPYKINGMIICGTNPAVTDCDTQTVRKALSEIEFLVVVDLFMTETAKYADVVLPATSFLETDLYRGGEKVVDPPGEAWPDEKIVVELAKKMGYEIDQLVNSSVTTGVSEVKYRKYLENGFQTSSGKVEFYSRELEELGFNPLPEYVEPIESSSNLEYSSEYPLILTTGAKLPMYTHSQFRGIPRLSNLFPDNYFSINPVTAVMYGVIDGERITVESPAGRLSGSVRTDLDLVENVVQVYHGFNDMNANLLTSGKYFDPGTASPGMKSSLCRIVIDKQSSNR